ncbi:MAG: V-type ATP synthase subunit D [Ruminococcaceae bacterium]|nr:V-type ATP synthase subunit D [Oscillospiraceae bacterium]
MAKIAPTKGNLLAEKKRLELARTGYELLDKKRNILIREMMQLIDTATDLHGRIDSTFGAAYSALQRANITGGVRRDLAEDVPFDDSLSIRYRSVMGVEIPIVECDKTMSAIPPYGLANSNSALDEAYLRFAEVKQLTAVMAEVENSVYRLADAIKKTQKRAKALKNIIIPQAEATICEISAVLEEKEREEFSRMKIIKSRG